MWIKNNKSNFLVNQIEKLNNAIEDNNLADLMDIFGNKKEIVKRNFLAGISRGVGIGIGVTVITAILIYILQKIVTLNIPVIGKYISDIIDIVQKSR